LLEELQPGRLWVQYADQAFLSFHFGTRMTVIRLADGGLFLHSPTPLSKELAAALRRLGPVRFIVAPSRFHHLHLGPYAKAFPEAEFHGTKRLLTKRRDIPWKGVLSDATPAPWRSDVRQVTFRGSFILDDVVFYDPTADILILTDLVQFHECREGSLYALIARMAGVYQRYGVPRDIRWTIWDRNAARRSLRTIMGWDFDRIVLPHGPIVPANGRRELERAMRWLR
jgi:hypothetical protein